MQTMQTMEGLKDNAERELVAEADPIREGAGQITK